MVNNQPDSGAAAADGGPGGFSLNNPAGLGLLAIGVVLLLLPVVVAVAAPAVLIDAQLYLRIIAALGGALIGGFIPGALQIALPGIKGVGALAVFALIYVVNPPAIGANTANPTSSVATTPVPPASTANQLKKWIVPASTGVAPSKIDTVHLQALQAWTSKNEQFKNIPIAVFVSSTNPTIEQARKTAIKELNIPKPQK